MNLIVLGSKQVKESGDEAVKENVLARFGHRIIIHYKLWHVLNDESQKPESILVCGLSYFFNGLLNK